MKTKMIFFTFLMAFWASVGFTSEVEPLMEPAELHRRLTAECNALGTIQTDDKFDFVKDSSLQAALAALPPRGVYQEIATVLAQIPETEVALQRRASTREPLAADKINDINAEMSSMSLLDLFNRRSTLLAYFPIETVDVPFDETATMKALYTERLDEEKACRLSVYLFSRKQKGEDLTGEIREFVEAQKGKPAPDIYHDLRFKVLCAAGGLGYTPELGNKERLSNTVRIIGDVFGRGSVDSTLNSLGYGDTWPVWRDQYGIKDGDRGAKAYDAARGFTVSSDNPVKREVRRIIDKL